MAISARIPSTLDAKYFIPEIWSKNVLVAVKNKLVVVPVVNHSYEKELVKGDTLWIPQTTVVTATEVTVGTEGVQSNPFNTAAVELDINLYFEAPITIDYMSRRQSQADVIALAEDESAYAISKKMDSTLCDLFSSLDSGGGTAGSAITDNVLIAAVEYLDEANAPEENRSWIFDPSCKADILKIDKFVRSDYFASDVIPTGGFRKDVYGAPILITNNLTVNSSGNTGAYLHRDALACVISEDMTVDRVEQPLKHQLVLNTTSLWGVKEIRGTFGYYIVTRAS
ncbi:MAG: hypothetical protein MUP81_00695 [Dehalococcoidia bacterium]|nr:hypothetical protein [Dehalococcoidia bacterium]